MSKTALPTTVERFVLNMEGLFQLISELVDSAYKSNYKVVNPTLVNVAGFVLFKLDKDYIIRTFIEKSHPHWELIKKRDEEFFVNASGKIFSGLPVDAIGAFKELVLLKTPSGERFITDDDRDAIWDYFESLVRISIHYLNENPKNNKWNMDLENITQMWR